MTQEEYMEFTNDYCGICLSCKEIAYGGIEPDAENYECQVCGEIWFSELKKH